MTATQRPQSPAHAAGSANQKTCHLSVDSPQAVRDSLAA